MHQPDEIDVRIDRIAQGGDGVARYQGMAVFVPGALPHEHVRVRIVQRRAEYLHGHIIEVLNASPDRVSPRFPHASHIPWQHITYSAQLRFKETIVREQLQHLGGIAEPPVAPTIAAPEQWHYRNTARFHVDDGQQAIGYYAPGSHQIIPLDHDPLLLPALDDAFAVIAQLLCAWSSADGHVQDVILRGSARYGYGVGVVTGRGDIESLAAQWQQQAPMLAATGTQQNQQQLRFHEELGGVIFSLSAGSFFQTYTAQAERLLQVICEGIPFDGTMTLVDAYGGAGAFALPLAGLVRHVIAIEENPWAVADGEETARLNEITTVSFVEASVEDALAREMTQRVDVVIVDPPRRGCHPAALKALADLAPRYIVYVACHPGILARDSRLLREGGYTLRHVQPIDLFPQTPHIESVAFFGHNEMGS